MPSKWLLFRILIFMNSDSLNMVSRLGEGHMPGTFFLSEPQLKTTVWDYDANTVTFNILLTLDYLISQLWAHSLSTSYGI